MGRGRKKKDSELDNSKKATTEKKVVAKTIENMSDAKEHAIKYLPGDDKRYSTAVINGEEVQVDNYDIMYVTSDKNVFYKANEGDARSHANKKKLQLFEVKL